MGDLPVHRPELRLGREERQDPQKRQPNAVYTPAMIVHAQRCRDATAIAISTAGVPIATTM